MRGEHPIRAPISTPAEGSSPHARGARRARASTRSSRGIIPACAGSTGVAITHCLMMGDHPRMRGEHHRNEEYVPEVRGSSPHARGARDDLEIVLRHVEYLRI